MYFSFKCHAHTNGTFKIVGIIFFAINSVQPLRSFELNQLDTNIPLDFKCIGLQHWTTVHEIAVMVPVNKDLIVKFGIKMSKIQLRFV